jgi:hypothetical protein
MITGAFLERDETVVQQKLGAQRLRRDEWFA